MARSHAVVVVVVVLLSGCQGAGPSPESVTPAPVPTGDGSVPVDAGLVANAHRAALADRSYTTTVVWRVTYSNGTVGRLTDQFVVGDGGSYRYERRQRGPYPGEWSSFVVWQNDSHEFRRTTAENGSTTVTVRRTTGFADTSLSGFVRRLLSNFDLTGERTTDGVAVSGTAPEFGRLPLPEGVHDGRDGRLDGDVRDDIVRRLTVSGRAETRDTDQTVDVGIRMTVDRVGRSEPTRPPWATDTGG